MTNMSSPFRGAESGTRLRVLCAQPDFAARILMQSALALDGHIALDVVPTGVEALLKLTAEPYDAVVLDDRLTDMSWHEVYAWLEVDEGLASVSVIVLTREPEALRIVKAASCVERPLDLDTLVLQLRICLAAAWRVIPLGHLETGTVRVK